MCKVCIVQYCSLYVQLLNKYEPDANETPISEAMVETIVRVAENTVDELTASEGREVRFV